MSLDPNDFATFEAASRAAGFDEVLTREWAPGLQLAEHTHPFTVSARVARGEMWLIVDGGDRHLRAGDEFQLEHDVLHGERYGPDGATVWVARRSAAKAT
jgi:quercetin dioxygenase-like cupin family protein